VEFAEGVRQRWCEWHERIGFRGIETFFFGSFRIREGQQRCDRLLDVGQ
jgi:hypothetical protein